MYVSHAVKTHAKMSGVSKQLKYVLHEDMWYTARQIKKLTLHYAPKIIEPRQMIRFVSVLLFLIHTVMIGTSTNEKCLLKSGTGNAAAGKGSRQSSLHSFKRGMHCVIN